MLKKSLGLFMVLLLLCSCGKVIRTTTTTTNSTTSTTTSTSTSTTSTTTTTIEDISGYFPSIQGRVWRYNQINYSAGVTSDAIVTMECMGEVTFPTFEVIGGPHPTTATRMNKITFVDPSHISTNIFYYISATQEVRQYTWIDPYFATYNKLFTPLITGEIQTKTGTVGAGTYTITVETLGFEPLILMQQSFNTVKVVSYILMDMGGSIQKMTFNDWYAPNVGLLKEEYFQFNDGIFTYASTQEAYDLQ